MPTLGNISLYADDNGNLIDSTVQTTGKINIVFRGKNNRLIVAPSAKIGSLDIRFDCDNATVKIGGNTGVPALVAFIRVGQDSQVILGDNVSSTRSCTFVAVEGTTLEVGDDVMIAAGVEIRTDDAHPIFDVESGVRINPSMNVRIGNHVWIANRAIIMPGTVIGDGSVVGHSSIVKGEFPNNCIIVGSPARVTRTNSAWERPHLSLTKPYYKPDASTVKKSKYWKLTEESKPADRRAC